MNKRNGAIYVIGFLALLILIALIYSIVQVADMRNPTMYVIGLVVVTLLSVWLLPKVWNGYNLSGESKYIWMGAGLVLLWLMVVLGVAAASNTNRDSCIPAEPLTSASGHIYNPDAYIAFHTQCEGNTTHFDNETINYIRTNSKLPSWIVVDGVTKDAVGWARAHGYTGAELSRVANEIADNNHFVPKQYLK